MRKVIPPYGSIANMKNYCYCLFVLRHFICGLRSQNEVMSVLF